MTEPLIDRNDLMRAVQSGVPIGSVGHVQPVTDAVLAYLRTTLTPEALECFQGNESIPVFSTGDGLHRRIFGEGTE